MSELHNKIKTLEKKLKDSAPKIPALIKNLIYIEKSTNNFGCHWVYVHRNDPILFDDPKTGGLMANAFNHAGFQVLHRGLLNRKFKVGTSYLPYIQVFKSVSTILNYNYNEEISIEVMEHLRLIFNSKETKKITTKTCTWNNDRDDFNTRYDNFQFFMNALLGGEAWRTQRVIFLTHSLYPDSGTSAKAKAVASDIEKYREILHDIATSHFNQEGRIFSVAVGDFKYRVGFSIYNVQSIHVLDVPANYADWLQSIARGVRMCGDYRLLKTERNTASTSKNRLDHVVPFVFTYMYETSRGARGRESRLLGPRGKYEGQAEEFAKLDVVLENQSFATINQILGNDKLTNLTPLPNYDNTTIKDFISKPEGSKRFLQILRNLVVMSKESVTDFLSKINTTLGKKNRATIETQAAAQLLESLVPEVLISLPKKETRVARIMNGNNSNSSNNNNNNEPSLTGNNNNNVNFNKVANESTFLTMFVLESVEYKVSLIALIVYIKTIVELIKDFEHKNKIKNLPMESKNHAFLKSPNSSDMRFAVYRFIYTVSYSKKILKEAKIKINNSNNGSTNIDAKDLGALYKKLRDPVFYGNKMKKIIEKNMNNSQGVLNIRRNSLKRAPVSNASNTFFTNVMDLPKFKEVMERMMCINRETSKSLFFRIVRALLKINDGICGGRYSASHTENFSNVKSFMSIDNNNNNNNNNNRPPVVAPQIREQNRASVFLNWVKKLKEAQTKGGLSEYITKSFELNNITCLMMPQHVLIAIFRAISEELKLSHRNKPLVRLSKKSVHRSLFILRKIFFRIYTPTTRMQAEVALRSNDPVNMRYVSDDAIYRHLSKYKSILSEFKSFAKKEAVDFKNMLARPASSSDRLPTVLYRYIGICSMLFGATQYKPDKHTINIYDFARANRALNICEAVCKVYLPNHPNVKALIDSKKFKDRSFETDLIRSALLTFIRETDSQRINHVIKLLKEKYKVQ